MKPWLNGKWTLKVNQCHIYWNNEKAWVVEYCAFRSAQLIVTMVYQCLHGQARCYLADHLIPASDAAPRRCRLRSANRNTVSLCLAVDSARTAVGHSTMLDRQSGTCCLMNLEILVFLNAVVYSCFMFDCTLSTYNKEWWWWRWCFMNTILSSRY